MLRLTRTHRIRVSNRMAVFAAFLLIAATMAGLGGTINGTISGEPTIADSSQAVDNTHQPSAVRSVRASKGFKVFYLFRHK